MSNPNYYGVTPSHDTPVKGRLRLPSQGVDVPLSLFAETTTLFLGRIANATQMHSFEKNAGWKFEADRPTLPTTPGFYAPKHGLRESGSLIHDYTVFGLTSRGEWTQLRGGNSPQSPVSIRSTVERLHADDNLVRVNIVRAD